MSDKSDRDLDPTPLLASLSACRYLLSFYAEKHKSNHKMEKKHKLDSNMERRNPSGKGIAIYENHSSQGNPVSIAKEHDSIQHQV
jgi:hypothetical protein